MMFNVVFADCSSHLSVCSPLVTFSSHNSQMSLVNPNPRFRRKVQYWNRKGGRKERASGDILTKLSLSVLEKSNSLNPYWHQQAASVTVHKTVSVMVKTAIRVALGSPGIFLLAQERNSSLPSFWSEQPREGTTRIHWPVISWQDAGPSHSYISPHSYFRYIDMFIFLK